MGSSGREVDALDPAVLVAGDGQHAPAGPRESERLVGRRDGHARQRRRGGRGLGHRLGRGGAAPQQERREKGTDRRAISHVSKPPLALPSGISQVYKSGPWRKGGRRAPAPARKRRGASAAGEGTRERILAAALEIFSQAGFDGATTRELAARAGVNLGLIKYYFGTKEQLWRDGRRPGGGRAPGGARPARSRTPSRRAPTWWSSCASRALRRPQSRLHPRHERRGEARRPAHAVARRPSRAAALRAAPGRLSPRRGRRGSCPTSRPCTSTTC